MALWYNVSLTKQKFRVRTTILFRSPNDIPSGGNPVLRNIVTSIIHESTMSSWNSSAQLASIQNNCVSGKSSRTPIASSPDLSRQR